MKKSERVTAFMESLGVAAGTSADPRYLGFFLCFNRGDYYEAHDVLEDLWLETTGPDYAFYKGLIQVAGCFVHLRKQFEHPEHHHHSRRMVPAARLFRIAIGHLEPFAPVHHGLEVTAVLRLCQDHLTRIESGNFRINPWSPEHLPQIRPQA